MTPPTSPRSGPCASLALACFFLSGASGLMFEMVWTRGLTLVFGSTTLAISTVLTAFMGGLGLGSVLAGRISDRIRDPLRAYALAELGVGLYALALPWVLARYPALNAWLWASFGDAAATLPPTHTGWNYALLSTLRFLASAGLLLLPTTLMGATLPLLGRYLVSRPSEMGGLGDPPGIALRASTCSGPWRGPSSPASSSCPRWGSGSPTSPPPGSTSAWRRWCCWPARCSSASRRAPRLDALAEQLGVEPSPASAGAAVPLTTPGPAGRAGRLRPLRSRPP